MRRRNGFDESIGEIRGILLGNPTTNAWWTIVEYLRQIPLGERQFAIDYLHSHTMDTEWWRTMVPCGCWDENNIGWDLSRITYEEIAANGDHPDAERLQEMVWCPPGTFAMGSGLREGRRNERPQHGVTLTEGFWIGQHEVTQGFWLDVMGGENPSYFSGGYDSLLRPVEQVNWYQAIRFCNALSEREGLVPVYTFQEPLFPPAPEGQEWIFDDASIEINQDANGYRLPTEAQWEYACRAGSTESRYGNLDDIAWYDGNSNNETEMVGELPPNAWDLYDMLGNVSEWCWDRHASYSAGADTDPSGASGSGPGHMSRGGSWFSLGEHTRAAYRDGHVSTHRSMTLGFRICRMGGDRTSTPSWSPARFSPMR